MLQQLEVPATFLNEKTEIEVDQLHIGAITYDPLHLESWRECVDTFLDAILTTRFVFSSSQLILFMIILLKLLEFA